MGNLRFPRRIVSAVTIGTILMGSVGFNPASAQDLNNIVPCPDTIREGVLCEKVPEGYQTYIMVQDGDSIKLVRDGLLTASSEPTGETQEVSPEPVVEESQDEAPATETETTVVEVEVDTTESATPVVEEEVVSEDTESTDVSTSDVTGPPPEDFIGGPISVEEAKSWCVDSLDGYDYGDLCRAKVIALNEVEGRAPNAHEGVHFSAGEAVPVKYPYGVFIENWDNFDYTYFYGSGEIIWTGQSTVRPYKIYSNPKRATYVETKDETTGEVTGGEYETTTACAATPDDMAALFGNVGPLGKASSWTNDGNRWTFTVDKPVAVSEAAMPAGYTAEVDGVQATEIGATTTGTLVCTAG